MIKSLQLQNPVNRIIRFRSLKFNNVFVCLISLLGIWLFHNFYQNDNFLISILVYILITFFILRQILAIGITFQNDINHSIDFSLNSNGWKVKNENDENLLKSKTIYTNRTNLKWVNNVEIIIHKDKERMTIYCNTYSIKEVISIFHFIDEQKLLNDLIGGK